MKGQVCTKCGDEKPFSEFYWVKSKNKYRKECVKCCNERNKKYCETYPEKTVLNSIKNRCNNSNNKDYKHYGGRGIKCLITEDEIRELMIRDGYWSMERPSIDRKNNNKHYTFENCQFIEQSKNSIKRNIEAPQGKPILQFDKQGNLIKEWCSQREAARQTGISQGNIWSCCNGIRYKSLGGFLWKYKN